MLIYLYVKTHTVTGLRYFGKTSEDPYKYRGSGVYWSRHLKEHGNSVQTEIIAEFDLETDKEQLVSTALLFSKQNDIVKSEMWANLIEENGLDGRPHGDSGHAHSQDTIALIAKKSKERWEDDSYRKIVTDAQKKSWTSGRKNRQSERLLAQKRPDQSEFMENKWKFSRESMFNVWTLERTSDHNKAISTALKGKKKSLEHIEAIKSAKKTLPPSKAPKNATWVSDGIYIVGGSLIIRSSTKGVWIIDANIRVRGLANAVNHVVDRERTSRN